MAESQSQTQPQAKQLMTDIFGDSDDDNNAPEPQKGSALSNMNFDDSDDDLFGRASDEDKGKSTSKKTATSSRLTQENLLDSDEDEDIQPKKGSVRRKRGKTQIPKTGGKLKKRKVSTSSSEKKSREDRGDRESGDEYDSGEDMGATKDDQDFIDQDDEFADLVKEYDEDNTDFRDDRPDYDDYDSKKGKKKKTMSASQNHHSSGINLKDSDPLSQTLAAMKQPKAKAQTDAEKDILVEKLQKQMSKAVELDNALYAQQQPAIHKMAMLEAVQTTLRMKHLHQTLLDKDILCSLRDWIEPRDSNTLAALSVRTAVYELLMQLPCLPDHLKRTNNEKPPIGVVIVSLRKHKMETPSNKRLLKELMDKWSRPIFSKSADVRLGGGTAGVSALPTADHPEMQEAILQRYAAQHQHHSSSSSISSSTAGGSGRVGSGSGDGSQRNVGFGLLSGQTESSADSSTEDGTIAPSKKAADLYTRARTPYNTGFLFTVQPELKNIDKRNVMERSLGEGRMKLFKKMTEGSGGGGGKGLGKKANPRAQDMSVSVGPKHWAS